MGRSDRRADAGLPKGSGPLDGDRLDRSTAAKARKRDERCSSGVVCEFEHCNVRRRPATFRRRTRSFDARGYHNASAFHTPARPVTGRHNLGEDIMVNFTSKVRRFLVSEDGPTAVEYAVMLALIVIVCLTAIQAIGTNATGTFQAVANELSQTV